MLTAPSSRCGWERGDPGAAVWGVPGRENDGRETLAPRGLWGRALRAGLGGGARDGLQTGLNFVDFPTTIWFETDYSVYVVRQASRRSWRIGQTRPVKVVFMSYRNTLQADALKLVAKKMQSSLAVEG